MKLGYALSSEEHEPNDLVRHAVLAEEAGFTFAFISDHVHPWVERQGHSSFVWAVIGGIAASTSTLRVGTGVTCPIIRIHPAIVAQAAATAALMLEGRFSLGVGTGENLNEHVLGDKWPPYQMRRAMLEEAIAVMRELWSGELTSHQGDFFEVENMRLYTIPDVPPDVYVAASGPSSAELAGEMADGMIGLAPDSSLTEAFAEAGGRDKPRIAQLTVCWGPSEEEARRTAHEWWPNAGIPGALTSELPLVEHFEQAARLVTEDAVAERIVCGPDLARHLEQIETYRQAGYDHMYIHQVGPDQAGFIDAYRREVIPQLAP